MAVTSVISVLACPTGKRYSTESLIYNELVAPKWQREMALENNEQTATTGSTPAVLDQLILSFLEAALIRDETSGIEPTVSRESSRGLARREYHRRFYRYEKHYAPRHRHHHRRLARARREANLQSRRVLSIVHQDENSTQSLENLENLRDIRVDEGCLRPEYIVFSWILCLIALASALKLYYLVKTALATMIVLMYTIIILVGCKNLFLSEIGASNV